MTFDYRRAQATADRLIKRYGQAGAIRRTETVGGAPSDPSTAQKTDIDHPCTLVVLDYEAREIDGARILSTDKKVLLSAKGLAVEPEITDRIVEVDGTVYAIVPPLKPLKPAGVAVLYEAQCRR